jgi:hypothetical protein
MSAAVGPDTGLPRDVHCARLSDVYTVSDTSQWCSQLRRAHRAEWNNSGEWRPWEKASVCSDDVGIPQYRMMERTFLHKFHPLRHWRSYSLRCVNAQVNGVRLESCSAHDVSLQLSAEDDRWLMVVMRMVKCQPSSLIGRRKSDGKTRGKRRSDSRRSRDINSAAHSYCLWGVQNCASCAFWGCIWPLTSMQFRGYKCMQLCFCCTARSYMAMLKHAQRLLHLALGKSQSLESLRCFPHLPQKYHWILFLSLFIKNSNLVLH